MFVIRFLEEVIKKEADKDDTLALAQDILGKAHPDAVSVIRHWITIIQSRWEEVMAWANQVILFFCLIWSARLGKQCCPNIVPMLAIDRTYINGKMRQSRCCNVVAILDPHAARATSNMEISDSLRAGKQYWDSIGSHIIIFNHVVHD
jgi:hypothetical protein